MISEKMKKENKYTHRQNKTTEKKKRKFANKDMYKETNKYKVRSIYCW